MSPEVSGNAPEIRLNIVLLPAPFGPIRPRISPLPIEKLKSFTATRPPKCLRAFRTSSSAPVPAARGRARERRRVGHRRRRTLRQPTGDPRPDAFARTLQNDDHQHAEHHHLEVAAASEQHRQPVLQQLLGERDERRADHRSPHAARAADDRHEQVFDPLRQPERRRVDESLQVRVQPARDACEQRRVDEDDDLESRRVDAESLGHLELAAERPDRASRPRVEQIRRRPQRHHRDGPDQEEVEALVLELEAEQMEHRHAGEARVAAEELDIAEQEIEARAPGDRRERKIVPAHPERDEPEAQREREGQHEPRRQVRPRRPAETRREDRRRVRADADERRLPERRLPGHAGQAARGRARRCCRGRCSCRG